MGIFSIKINNEFIDVTRDETYTVTHIPRESVSRKPLQKTGVVLGRSLSLHFLNMRIGDVEYEIPISEITSIVKA